MSQYLYNSVSFIDCKVIELIAYFSDSVDEYRALRVGFYFVSKSSDASVHTARGYEIIVAPDSI